MKYKLVRVSYGKKTTPKEDREYRLDKRQEKALPACVARRVSPVGTMKEWKERHPNSSFEIAEKD